MGCNGQTLSIALLYRTVLYPAFIDLILDQKVAKNIQNTTYNRDIHNAENVMTEHLYK